MEYDEYEDDSHRESYDEESNNDIEDEFCECGHYCYGCLGISRSDFI